MRKLIFFLLLSIYCSESFSQNVGIGTSNPLNKLHIAGGLRVDTLANGIDSGVLIHNKNGVVFRVKFTGLPTDVLRGDGSFGAAPTGPAGWFLNGNAGTNPLTHFIGTTDDKPLKFRVNNFPAGQIDHVNDNVGFGLNTFGNISTGSGNSFFGSNAGSTTNTGSENVFIGAYSGASNFSGNYNSFVGTFSGNFNQSGHYNTFMGNRSGYHNMTGMNNSFFGMQSGSGNTTGNQNSFFG